MHSRGVNRGEAGGIRAEPKGCPESFAEVGGSGPRPSGGWYQFGITRHTQTPQEGTL